jgi:Cytochrome c3
MRTALVAFGVAILSLSALAAPPPSPPRSETSCIHCHGGELFDEAAQAKVKHFNIDVHSQVGLSCHDCHGGNPDPKLGDDINGAMDPQYKPNPYVGAPKRPNIPDFCGRCHSSAAYMNRFNPAARVDEVSEYWTSHHGQKLKSGVTDVATCIDCHSVHDIRRKGNPDAPVYPTHVAETCSRCHSDAKRMTANGRSIPVDQYARWSRSVHAKALLEKGDLTAPTCNDCHGNHGAAPPGIGSIRFVCGSCHAREAELFRASPKAAGWDRHNEFLAAAPDGKCGTCHEDERASLHFTQLSSCLICHENHAVVRPTVAMLGQLPDTPCAFCHEGVGPLVGFVQEPKAEAEHFAQMRATLLAAAKRLHLQGDARFDWLVDQALQLPTHRIQSGPGGKGQLRPEFARLFEKFRIGKTHYTYRDPSTGHDVTVAVRQCTDCHRVSGLQGRDTSQGLLAGTRAVTSMIARSERILLAAQRGGVEVRAVRSELDAAVDNQIELETLVHTFSPTGAFAEKQREALQHAHAALEAGQHSLDELAYRRRGLFIALGVVLAALVAMALKIRQA